MPMEIVAHNKSMRMYHARFGYNRLFGLDVVKRKAMKDAEAVALFDSVWGNMLGDAVHSAEVISYEEARGLPREKDRSWVDSSQEHRRFRILDGLHVAQLRQVDTNTLEMTNLWFIASSNPDPRTVFVTFATLDIRREFEDQAIQHGLEGQAWGEKLLLDWLESVTQKKYERAYQKR
jgi:hypothetical protein